MSALLGDIKSRSIRRGRKIAVSVRVLPRHRVVEHAFPVARLVLAGAIQRRPIDDRQARLAAGSEPIGEHHSCGP
ncbi:MAG: hypothetical protein JSV19_12985 [Phycisphaerales bacterium]|nr:MAG: hypothetical protein JSV19_12985 [Phycisphaerales bacterium]